MIQQILKEGIKKVSGVENFDLQFPENQDFGDFTTNVALRIAKKGQNPREVAEDLKSKLEKEEVSKIVEKIEVAGPGFINFWLKKDSIIDVLSSINTDIDVFSKSDNLKGKRINLEFGQPNTHKLPHIGHLFCYIYGEALAKLLEANGAIVYRVNYQGDVGLHVAKCLWAIKQGSEEGYKEVENKSLEEKAAFLQQMYQKGSAAYEENDDAKKGIQAINKQIYEQDPEIFSLWEQTRSWSVEYYKIFEERLGIAYDRYYYESEVYNDGLKIVKENLGKVFEESERAIIFEGSKHGLHDRVFVTQYKTPTYEAKDLYLEVLKNKEWPYDLLIITTANEQNEYFKVVYKALEIVNPGLLGKLTHIGFGMINLKSGKMSSRTGNIISGIDLVDTVVDKVKQFDIDGKLAEAVGLGAVKYSFLKNNPLQNTSFSIEESIAAEGNSGPYLQYTFARANSVLAKSKGRKSGKLDPKNFGEIETKIARKLSQFPEVIAIAAKNYSPNILATYLYTVAQMFNNFYNSNKIIGSAEEVERVALTSGVSKILKNGLNLLGIETPEKM